MRNFDTLFTISNPLSPFFDDLISCCVTNEENDNLMKVPLVEEIKEAIRDFHPLKSPRPDGFSGIFFRNYWDIIGQQTTSFVQECFKSGYIQKDINRMFIVLILKVSGASNFSQFSPISLCNFTYKIVSKILATRLRFLIPKIVSLNQGAFVEG